MLVAGAITEPTLLGLAALITALGGIASTIMALRKSRSEEFKEMEQNLKESRTEVERLAEENHRLKMEKIEREEEGDEG